MTQVWYGHMIADGHIWHRWSLAHTVPGRCDQFCCGVHRQLMFVAVSCQWSFVLHWCSVLTSEITSELDLVLWIILFKFWFYLRRIWDVHLWDFPPRWMLLFFSHSCDLVSWCDVLCDNNDVQHDLFWCCKLLQHSLLITVWNMVPPFGYTVVLHCVIQCSTPVLGCSTHTTTKLSLLIHYVFINMSTTNKIPFTSFVLGWRQKSRDTDIWKPGKQNQNCLHG